MRMKQLHLMYDENNDNVAIVHFVAGKPVDAMDVNQEFVHAITRWCEETEVADGHFKRVYWRPLLRLLGFKRKYVRHMDDSRGVSYTITMTKTSIKEPKNVNTVQPSGPSEESSD